MRPIFLLFACALALFALEDLYTGKWTSSETGNGGDFRLRVKPAPEVAFTYAGQEMKTQTVSFNETGTGLEMVYEFEIEGSKLRSAIRGDLKDGKLEGKYLVTAVESDSPVDAGTFEALVVK